MPQARAIPARIRAGGAVAVAACVLLGLAGCATRVANTSDPLLSTQLGSMPLPRPQNVIVLDFTADQARLQLDQGIGPRLRRTMDGNAAAQQETMVAEVQNAIADALVANIRKMGLPAERAAEAPAPEADTVVVQGQIQDIDQGNRTRRFGIGFGAGKSDVSAHVEAYYQRPGMPGQLLQTYTASSNSGRKPGMALGGAMSAVRGGLAPAALTGATGAVSERNKSPVAKEGAQLGDHVAHELGQFFARQGWIPPSAAR